MQALEVDSRPWGMYEVLLDAVDCKVKRITVAPGQRLSYQSHKHREENWVVVRGVLTVIKEEKEYTIYPGESIFISQGDKHRAWNKTSKPVQFIEVQTGDYFGEDDIVRYEDDYQRAELEHLRDGNYIGGLTMPERNTNKLNKNG